MQECFFVALRGAPQQNVFSLLPLDPHLSRRDVLFGFSNYFPAATQKVPRAFRFPAKKSVTLVFTLGWTRVS
jgi:hypothetical protein